MVITGHPTFPRVQIKSCSYSCISSRSDVNWTSWILPFYSPFRPFLLYKNPKA